MKILVCVKQVPGSSNVEVDPQTGVLKRSGIASKINPYDLYALETAFSLAERFGGTVDHGSSPGQGCDFGIHCHGRYPWRCAHGPEVCRR